MPDIGESNPSSPAFFNKPIAPVISYYETQTAKEAALVFLKCNIEDRLIVNDRGVDPDSKFSNGDFCIFVPLVVGTNSYTAIAQDVEGNFSESTTFSITRLNRDLVSRGTRVTLTIGAFNASDYLDGTPSIEWDRETGVGTLQFKLAGNFSAARYPWLKYNTEIVFTLDDGVMTKSWKFKLDWFHRAHAADGEQTVEIKGLSSNKKLLELELSQTIGGQHNGEVLTEICGFAGYSKVYTPVGLTYSGPRIVDKMKATELIKEISLVEGWVMKEINDTTIAFLPDLAFQAPMWTFSDNEIFTIEEEVDGQRLLNKLRVKYIKPNQPEDYNPNFENMVPDKSLETVKGFALYTSDTFKAEATTVSADSILFFGCWDPAIDWTKLKVCQLLMRFSESASGQSTFRKTIDLQPYPLKKMAVMYYDLRPYHLKEELPIYWQLNIQDKNGVRYSTNPGIWNYFVLGGESAKFDKLVTSYGVQMGENEKLGTFDQSWEISTGDTLPREGEKDVAYIKIIEKGVAVSSTTASSTSQTTGLNAVTEWDYEMILEVVVDDAVLHTLTTDLDQATASPTTEVALINASVFTDKNVDINGNAYIYAVRSHSPNLPIRRVDSIFVKIKGTIKTGQTIKAKFNWWGRKFISSANYIDFNNIDVSVKDDASIAQYGERDGGILVSGYLGSTIQATNLAMKELTARRDAPAVVTVETPPMIEMTENQLIRVVSESAELDAYYWTQSVSPGSEYNTVQMARAMPVLLQREGLDIYTLRYYASDESISLSKTMAEAIKNQFGLLKGTVEANKYRGMFSVELDDGSIVHNVNSRIEGIKGGDKVMVAQSKEGDYLIIALIDADAEEFDKTADLAEGELGPDPDSQEGENISDTGRDIGNFIKVMSVKATIQDADGVIASNSSFEITMSHDFYCGPPSQSVANNLSCFIVIVETGSDSDIIMPFTFGVSPIAARKFLLTPGSALRFGNTVKIFIGNHGISSNPFYKANAMALQSSFGGAVMLDSAAFSQDFTVEPLMEIIGYERTSPFAVRPIFNQYITPPDEGPAQDSGIKVYFDFETQ